MPTLAQRLANPNVKVPVMHVKHNRKVTLRRFDIIAYRGRRKPVTFSNLTNKEADEKKANLYAEGYTRVDKIEVKTKVYKKELTFSGNHEGPQKMAPIAIPEAQPKANAQATFPWEVLSNDIPAYLSPDPKFIQRDRIKESTRANLLRSRKSASIERSSDRIYLCDADTGNIVFSGTTNEAIFFLMNTDTDLSNLIGKE